MFGSDPMKKHLPWTPEGEDVATTPSGLQYKILKSGPESGASPEPTDEVIVHYDGRLAANGKKFDSSYDRKQPLRAPANRLIPGWVEALQLMRPGDEWVLYIPSELGYGSRGAGGAIPPDADLLFRVELLEVQKPPEPEYSNTSAWETHTPWNSDSDSVVKTESGLEYVWLEEGTADAPKPGRNNQVTVFYEGRLAANGELFDSAYQRGQPAQFGVTQVISGWTEMLQLMPIGSRALVYIPAPLGYGASGTPGGPIPPNADLIFEVQLMDIG